MRRQYPEYRCQTLKKNIYKDMLIQLHTFACVFKVDFAFSGKENSFDITTFIDSKTGLQDSL